MNDKKSIWEKNGVKCTLLFSIAGLATQLLLQAKNGEGFLLDLGDGVCRDLISYNIDFHSIQGVALTHGHFDHCGALHSFLGFLRMIGRTKELHIVYPKDSIEINGLMKNFETCYSESIPFVIKKHPITPKTSKAIQINRWILTPIAVEHRGSTAKFGIGKPIPAYGYQVSIEGVVIAFAGDTGPTDSLYRLFSSKVDLGICEATYPDQSWVSNKELRFHLTENEACEFTKSCKERWLVHKLPDHVLAKK
ncbi:MAG: MBL fold metallo-hydrolase [Promethearchaeota archaeon]